MSNHSLSFAHVALTLLQVTRGVDFGNGWLLPGLLPDCTSTDDPDPCQESEDYLFAQDACFTISDPDGKLLLALCLPSPLPEICPKIVKISFVSCALSSINCNYIFALSFF